MTHGSKPLLIPTLMWTSFLLACTSTENYRQETDLSADTTIATPRFALGTGPIVVIDAAHGNLHTVDGSYAPFARLLRNDGLRVSGSDSELSPSLLDGIDLLVIANARSDSGAAFTDDELTSLESYLKAGGALLLIGDHPPYAAAAVHLARAFGVEWLDVGTTGVGSDIFSLANGALADDPVLGGVTQVVASTGSCFRAEGVRPLLQLDDRWSMQSVTATGLSAKRPATGCLQGALLEIGAGRVGLFAEAGMFTAQLFYRGEKATRIGFHADGAEQQRAFILNVVHWLVRADG